MINKIEHIPWRTLNANIDQPEQLADLLTQLLSGTSDNSEALLEQILDAIYEQGDIFEVTPYVLPFLLTFAQQASEQELLSLFIPLAVIATEVHEGVHSARKKTSALVTNTYRAIYDGVPLYISLLQQQQVELRGLATYVLRFCSVSTIDIIHPLKEQLSKEHDEVIRFLSIRAITAHKGFSKHELTTLFTSTSNTMERYALALSLVETLRGKVTLEVGKVITELIQVGVEENLRRVLDLIPILDISQETAKAFELLGRSKSVPLLCQIIMQWPIKNPPYNLVETIEQLLDSVGFPKGGTIQSLGPVRGGQWRIHYRLYHGTSAVTTPPTNPSPFQQQVLASICACEPFWSIDTNLLQIYALPTNRESLRAYIP